MTLFQTSHNNPVKYQSKAINLLNNSTVSSTVLQSINTHSFSCVCVSDHSHNCPEGSTAMNKYLK